MGRRNQVLASGDGDGDGSLTTLSYFSPSSMSAPSSAAADKNLKAGFLDEDPLSLLPETKTEDHDEEHRQKSTATKDHHEDSKPYEVQLVWRNIFALGILHLITLYTLTMVPSMHYATIFWAYAVIILGSMGVQSGAHRYDKK